MYVALDAEPRRWPGREVIYASGLAALALGFQGAAVYGDERTIRDFDAASPILGLHGILAASAS